MQKTGIVCEQVTKKYGELVALRGVDLVINSGDFLVLFGPNGAGKSTLMKTLCGLTRPTTGTATVLGSDVSDTEVRKKVGVISHQSYLYNNLTAMENLIFYGDLYEVDNPAARAEKLLKDVELFDRKDDLACHFSRGMTQRLSIARALVADPEFIFLDEPFTGLDQHSGDLFKNLLTELHKRGKTLMMITHDIPVGLEISNRVAILKKGKIIFDEPPTKFSVDEFKQIYSDKISA